MVGLKKYSNRTQVAINTALLRNLGQVTIRIRLKVQVCLKTNTRKLTVWTLDLSDGSLKRPTKTLQRETREKMAHSLLSIIASTYSVQRMP